VSAFTRRRRRQALACAAGVVLFAVADFVLPTLTGFVFLTLPCLILMAACLIFGIVLWHFSDPVFDPSRRDGDD
jgi:fatty acid desaturase